MFLKKKKALIPVKLVSPYRRSPYLTGFTLIELLIVVAIIGILSSLVFFNVRDAQSKSRDTKRKTEIGDIKKALESFRIDKGRYAKCDYSTQIGKKCGFAKSIAADGIVGEVWAVDGIGLVSADAVLLSELIHPFPLDPKVDKYYTYATNDPTTGLITDGYYASYSIAVALENPTGLQYIDKLEAADLKSYYHCRTGQNFISVDYFDPWFNHSGGTVTTYGQPCNF